MQVEFLETREVVATYETGDLSPAEFAEQMNNDPGKYNRTAPKRQKLHRKVSLQVPENEEEPAEEPADTDDTTVEVVEV